jgi:hypothetical protein
MIYFAQKSAGMVLSQKGKNFGAGKFLPFCFSCVSGSAARRPRAHFGL